MWFQEVSDKFLKILARGFKETKPIRGFQSISGDFWWSQGVSEGLHRVLEGSQVNNRRFYWGLKVSQGIREIEKTHHT